MPHFHPANVLDASSREAHAEGLASDPPRHSRVFLFKSPRGGKERVILAMDLTRAHNLLVALPDLGRDFHAYEFAREIDAAEADARRSDGQKRSDAILNVLALIAFELRQLTQGRGYKVDPLVDTLSGVVSGVCARLDGDEVTRAEALGLVQGAIIATEPVAHRIRPYFVEHGSAALNILVALRDVLQGYGRLPEYLATVQDAGALLHKALR